MEVKATLIPSQAGTQHLVKEYGDQLVCVRYRYDKTKKNDDPRPSNSSSMTSPGLHPWNTTSNHLHQKTYCCASTTRKPNCASK